MTRQEHRQNGGQDAAQRPDSAPATDALGGVHIAHERPAPETEPHVIAPLILVLTDGTRLVARKWWLGGISDAALSGHDLADARMEIPFQGIDVGFPVQLDPMGDGGPWLFRDLTGRQREALGLFYQNLLTGKMAATDEVITALDTPVDLIPMGETAQEQAAGQAHAKPRVLRIVSNILWYVGLFCLLVGFLGSFAWSRIEGITLSHARVYAERQELRAPREGYLNRIALDPGPLQEGTILARLEDPEIEAALKDVQSRVDLLEARITEGRERLSLHLSMREDVRETLGRLYSDAAMARFDAGISIRPGDYNDQRTRLEQELRDFETDLARATSELRNLRQQRTSMQIASPTGGLVAEWLAQDGQYMRAGDTLAIYETNAPRVIRGWLDDRATGSVRPGMQAEITVPGRDQETRITGRVITVEAGANPSEPDRFGLIVTIKAVGLTPDETRARLRVNTPTEVVVKRGLLARWFGTGG